MQKEISLLLLAVLTISMVSAVGTSYTLEEAEAVARGESLDIPEVILNDTSEPTNQTAKEIDAQAIDDVIFMGSIFVLVSMIVGAILLVSYLYAFEHA